MILTIRTDKQDAEIGLFSDEGKKISYKTWQAHRELSSTILGVIKELLDSQKLDFKDITGVVFYKGPGSFTGLRIGITVANTIAYAQHLPIIGETDEIWNQIGVRRLIAGENDQIVLPLYGAEPRITTARK